MNATAPAAPKSGLSLHVKMLIGFVLGTVVGVVCHQVAPDSAVVHNLVAYLAVPIRTIFLNLLFMLALPLMFSALILGVAELGDIASLGKLGLRTLVFTAVLTAIAVMLGLLMVNLIRPGIGMDPAIMQSMLASGGEKAKEIAAAGGAGLSPMQLLLGIVPKNVVLAATDDKEKLGLMFFAVMLGIGLVLSPTVGAQRFKEAIQGLFDITMRLIGLVIRTAPYAVAFMMFAITAEFGWELLLQLGKYAATVILALGVHMFVVLPLWVRYMGNMKPSVFFRESQEAILTAFATASSAGTLPITLRVAEENLKLPQKVSRFVLTVGASANHHGTALFEGVTTLFLAQAFNVDLTVSEQLIVLGLCILGGIGTAGVPAGSLPVIAMICLIIGVPPEGIGIILGVDRFLDMCRTSLNVTGDLATAVVVANQTRDLDVPEDLPQSSTHGH